MITKNSPRKDDVRKQLNNNLALHIEEYHHCFRNETSDGHELGAAYIRGLFKTEAGKRNIERMNEELELSGDGYQRVQQFITNSTWSAPNLISEIALNTSDLYASENEYRRCDVGYIIDESAHIKKGKNSAGVARQYAGVRGKVENCQVGVYVSLVWNAHSTLINERLFLPECWTSDPKRCEKAGIPEEKRTFKTKLDLALEMVKADVEAGVEFGWVGGDGLYGHGSELGNSLDNMGLTFILDVHCNQQIYPTKPDLGVPESASKRGAKPTKLRADRDSIRVDLYAQQLSIYEWQTITVRDGTKGQLTLSMHASRVWLWDGKSDALTERVLVISRNQSDNKIKYSLSNADYLTTSIQRFAYMQAQRYWVERAFQEAKSEFGMSDYQVRKWDAWHHHMALVMLSLSFIVKERMFYKDDCPLLSCRDIRLMIIAMLLNDPAAVDKKIAQMEIRHKQRREDIDRRYKANVAA
ncbi:MAG: IS701 family transposase [Thiocapsa sp.]|uniref:IS701 family transposase n=1 Tax=Thiocapsa sp. TaxID=2024551 RepID=UPI001BCA90B6|nr:IS701 family transposase [Thiocapsa sp.]QVL48829.1 MAG: IS701 family transposase [Thiocapsa sp.]